MAHKTDVWAYVKTWNQDCCRRVLVGVFHRFVDVCSSELTLLGRLLSSVGSEVSLVALCGGSERVAEVYEEYLGTGRTRSLIEYPLFDLQTLRRCVQKSGSSAFGSMDPFSLVEFLVVRLKGAAHRDWMTSRPALRQALETGCLELPSLLDVVGNLAGAWPLVVAFMKETSRASSGDSLMVGTLCLLRGRLRSYCIHKCCCCCLEKRTRRLRLQRQSCSCETATVSPAA